MVIKPSCYKLLKVPDFILSDNVLSVTDVTKYLGCLISDNCCDDKDILRAVRSLYARGNFLISKFRNCTSDVKSKLFKSYCTSFYGINLWYSYHATVKRKVNIAYKKIFRALFNHKRDGTTFNMLTYTINPFSCMERNLVYGFTKRIESCDNTIVHTITNSVFYRSSKFHDNCMKLLFTP